MVELSRILINHPQEYVNSENLPANFEDVQYFHRSMPSYSISPLHALKFLSKKLNVKGIYVKDESTRFGLNAFKGLGVSYAVHRLIDKQSSQSYTLVSCTDGNHGKALAWMAKQLGHHAIIFMPKGSEERRAKAIEEYHAKVIITDMNYDDTVRYAAAYAEKNNAFLVQDTSWPGYTQVPNDIILGYSTLVREALDQMEEKPTHIFIQAGVGSLAGGIIWYLLHRYPEALPFIGILEAESVACIYESVRQNKNFRCGGEPYTAMAGLNCGEASQNVFPLIKAKSNCFVKCSDKLTFKGMARAKNPMGGDPSFSSGESGAVGLGLVEEILSNPDNFEKKEQLKLNSESVILLFSTEGEILDA